MEDWPDRLKLFAVLSSIKALLEKTERGQVSTVDKIRRKQWTNVCFKKRIGKMSKVET
jgi:hypothetical protein